MDNANLLILVVLILCSFVLLYYAISRRSTAKLKIKYDEALKGGKKADALKAGREYYAALRGGRLTVYDEQAIANDISVM
jgi:hypothetical protein